LSYTPLESSGGVPRWCRDFIAGFPGTKHFSWWDCAIPNGIDPNSQYIPEWEKAKLLNRFLMARGHIGVNDIVIGDNWWVDGLERRERTVSVAHGNWSHTTYEDVERGIQPEFPAHAAQQLAWRKRYTDAGRKIVAVSDFIAYEMKRQWGFDSTVVINNGIDLEKFKPSSVEKTSVRNRNLKHFEQRKPPLIIHFTTTANKGLDHIEAVKNDVDAYVWLLDYAAERLNLPKYEALARADLVVHPSAHEGNSYAVLETLACDVPIVAYNVGLMFIAHGDMDSNIGEIPGRTLRTPQLTVECVKSVLDQISDGVRFTPRKWVEQFSIQHFHAAWRDYLAKEFGYVVRV
jgi:glycosyltransferase involved in cell wall biosynthesis